MLGHGGSSAGSYLADPYFPHPLALCCHYPVSKCCSASIVVTGTVRVNGYSLSTRTGSRLGIREEQIKGSPCVYSCWCTTHATSLICVQLLIKVGLQKGMTDDTAHKATILQVTTMLVTSKNPFPHHNHLLTTSTDDPNALIIPPSVSE